MHFWIVLACLWALTLGEGVAQIKGDGESLFYMYELPERVVDTWPASNLTLVRWSIYNSSFAENAGAGPLIDPSMGMYGTWQFSLFKLVYNRLSRSPRRTLDPERADLFFVPYDGGMDATVSAWDGRSLKGRCPRSGIVTNFLGGNDQNAAKQMDRHGGRDHFIIFGVIQGVASLSSPGCRRLYRGRCQHCRKLSIEISYQEEDLPKFDPKKSSDAYKYDPTWTSVPYPSSFHYTDNASVSPWQREVGVDAEPDSTWAIYIGGMHTTNTQSNHIRKRLAAACNAVPDDTCTWLALGKAGARYSAADILARYRRSTFCLHPPGDSPTRKGIFDSLLTGCIPVVFNKFSLGNQYDWHLGAALREKVTVFVPPDEPDFLGYLRQNYDRSRVLAMQRAIAHAAFGLQYSLPPPGPKPHVWAPPKPDAVDVLLDGMYRQFVRERDALAAAATAVQTPVQAAAKREREPWLETLKR